jgi:hypothetical protein
MADDQRIGQVVWVKGVLKATQPKATERTLTRRSPIFVSDTLVTDAKSTGQIVFTDDSLLAIRENTSLQISQYKYNTKDPTQDSYVADLAKGGFRTITGAISKNNPSQYQAKTPVATISVRGTEFSVYYTPGGKNGMVTKLESGSIEVANSAGKVILKKCTPEEIKKQNCQNQLYSRVTSATEAPQIVNQMPAEFTNDIQIVSSLWGVSTQMNGGVVSGFCIQ